MDPQQVGYDINGKLPTGAVCEEVKLISAFSHQNLNSDGCLCSKCTFGKLEGNINPWWYNT